MCKINDVELEKYTLRMVIGEETSEMASPTEKEFF